MVRQGPPFFRLLQPIPLLPGTAGFVLDEYTGYTNAALADGDTPDESLQTLLRRVRDPIWCARKESNLHGCYSTRLSFWRGCRYATGAFGGKWTESNLLLNENAFTARRRHQPVLIGTSHEVCKLFRTDWLPCQAVLFLSCDPLMILLSRIASQTTSVTNPTPIIPRMIHQMYADINHFPAM